MSIGATYDAAMNKYDETHIARHVEVRSDAEMTNLERADAFVAFYSLSEPEALQLMMTLRGLYRGNSTLSRPLATLLDDFARAVDDYWIEARKIAAVEGSSEPAPTN